ncbi:MAG: hypothetical protein J5755_02970, partial [Clostridia bacterium]|nr:hypothetical protein [Clostridia bacterium]
AAFTVTGVEAAIAAGHGGNVSTIYLDGEMIDLDAFSVLYTYAQGHALALNVPSALLADYQSTYQAYVDQLDNLSLS